MTKQGGPPADYIADEGMQLEQEPLGSVPDLRTRNSSWEPVLLEGNLDQAALEIKTYGGKVVRGFTNRMAARNTGRALVRHLRSATTPAQYAGTIDTSTKRWQKQQRIVEVADAIDVSLVGQDACTNCFSELADVNGRGVRARHAEDPT